MSSTGAVTFALQSGRQVLPNSICQNAERSYSVLDGTVMVFSCANASDTPAIIRSSSPRQRLFFIFRYLLFFFFFCFFFSRLLVRQVLRSIDLAGPAFI